MKITEDDNNRTDEFSYLNKSQTHEQEEIIIREYESNRTTENICKTENNRTT